METVDKAELSPDELLRQGSDRIMVRVRSITYEGEGINSYEVVPINETMLPPFTAGSHIDLYFRDQRIRQYSLCNNPEERHRYVFAVQNELNGRGGSKAIFERVQPGRILLVSKPRNNFDLIPSAKHYILIAGGIGVTPLMSMLYRLDQSDASFSLHYCARSAERTAFRSELQPYIEAGKVFLYHDNGDPKKGLKLASLLGEHEAGTHLYACGPTGLLDAILKASDHWPDECRHFERFTITAKEDTTDAGSRSNSASDIPLGFQVKIASTGAVYDVPDDKSIAQVLREHGVNVQTSCEAGLCGTCKTGYLEGVPDHRDYILSNSEKEKQLLICCSRSKLPLLVLDL